MGPRNRIQSCRILLRSDSHWARERIGAPPGPTSRGARSGASGGSLEGAVCTSSSHATSPVPARPGLAPQASPARIAGAPATNLRRETPWATDPARLDMSEPFMVGSSRCNLATEHPPPHQPLPVGSASATPPQGGSDSRVTNRKHTLHIRPGTWLTSYPGIGQVASCRPQVSLPPGGGVGETRAPPAVEPEGGTESARSPPRRFSPQSSRRGQTRLTGSECRRYRQRRVGVAVRALYGRLQIPLNPVCYNGGF